LSLLIRPSRVNSPCSARPALHRRATLAHGNCATTLVDVFEFGVDVLWERYNAIITLADSEIMTDTSPEKVSSESLWAGQSGERWLTNADRFEEMLEPIGQALIELAAFQPGEQIKERLKTFETKDGVQMSAAAWLISGHA
jgi:hypothetical protein